MADDLEMFYHLWADEGWKSLLFSVYLIWKRKRVRWLPSPRAEGLSCINAADRSKMPAGGSHSFTLHGSWVSGDRTGFLESPPIGGAHRPLGRPCATVTVLSSSDLRTRMWDTGFPWAVGHCPAPPLPRAPFEGQDQGHTRDLREPTFQEEETDNSRGPAAWLLTESQRKL